MLLEHPSQVGGCHPNKALILKGYEKLRLTGTPGSNPLSDLALKKRGFPSAPHADNGQSLAPDTRDVNVAWCELTDGCGEGFVELQSQQISAEFPFHKECIS